MGHCSPELERACVPLPETDGAVGSSGGQVALGAATERRKLRAQPEEEVTAERNEQSKEVANATAKKKRTINNK